MEAEKEDSRWVGSSAIIKGLTGRGLSHVSKTLNNDPTRTP